MRLLLAVRIGAWSAIWLAATSACAQEIVNIDASQPDVSRRVLLRAELHRPRGEGPFPAVVLMHGCSGWVPAVHYKLRDYAEELRKRGYVALNLDSFGPRHYSGDEMCASNARLREALNYRAADAFDAMRYLGTLPYVDARNIGLVGQSNGGSVAMKVAQASAAKTYDKSGGPGFRAIVAYYPWCGMFAGNVRLVAPVKVFSGGRDEWVSARECASVRASGEEYQFKLYPKAVHSFDLDIPVQSYAGFMVGKDPEAAEDSRKRMFDFFRAHLTEEQKSARQFTD
jgi:dienelactone hydrolase